MRNIAVLVSGGGTNLQALLDAQAQGYLTHGKVSLVIADRKGTYAIQRAEKAGIPSLVLDRKQPDFEQALAKELVRNNIDLIVLAGFLSILGKDFVRQFDQKIINVHPSLIPSFCGAGYYGLKVHEAALQAGVKLSGATVHFVNEIPDGGTILLQQAVKVQGDDTPATLQQRIMQEAEWQLLWKAAQMLCKQMDQGEEDDHY